MTNLTRKEIATALLKSMQELAKERGGQCLSTTYENTRAKLKWQCAHGHTWESSRIMVLKKGSWCPTCVLRERQSKAFAQVQATAQEQGGICLSTQDQYLNNQSKLTYRCNHGHEWQATSAQITSVKSWCPTCSINQGKHTLDHPHGLAVQRGGVSLTEEHTSMKHVVSWQCAMGHTWQAPPSHIYTGSWCHLCASKQQRSTLEEIQEVAKARGELCLATEYKNTYIKLLWECHLGHQWEATANNIKAG